MLKHTLKILPFLSFLRHLKWSQKRFDYKLWNNSGGNEGAKVNHQKVHVKNVTFSGQHTMWKWNCSRDLMAVVPIFLVSLKLLHFHIFWRPENFKKCHRFWAGSSVNL